MILHGFSDEMDEKRKEDQDLYYHIFKNLTYGTVYNIAVRGKNKEFLHEGRCNWITVQVPNCTHFHIDKSLCGPAIEDLRANVSSSDGRLMNISVSWKKPVNEPDFYLLEIRDMFPANNSEVASGIFNYTVAKVKFTSFS